MGTVLNVIMDKVLSAAQGKEVGMVQDCSPTFARNTGFDFERAERVMKADMDCLKSARILPEDRDYCAHYLLQYKICRYNNWPLVYRCAHEKHDFLNCEHDDYVIRMKEFERELRLRRREKRIADCKASAPLPSDEK